MTWVPPTTCHHYIKWSGAGPTGKSSSDTSQQLPYILVIARIRAHQSNKIHSQSQKTKIQRKRKLESGIDCQRSPSSLPNSRKEDFQKAIQTSQATRGLTGHARLHLGLKASSWHILQLSPTDCYHIGCPEALQRTQEHHASSIGP